MQPGSKTCNRIVGKKKEKPLKYIQVLRQSLSMIPKALLHKTFKYLEGCQSRFTPIILKTRFYMAYLDVHSRAVLSCRVRSVFNSCAISGTSGSSGFGSVNSEQILNNTLEIVNAGLH